MGLVIDDTGQVTYNLVGAPKGTVVTTKDQQFIEAARVKRERKNARRARIFGVSPK